MNGGFDLIKDGETAIDFICYLDLLCNGRKGKCN